MARLSAVASLLAILPLSTSGFCPLTLLLPPILSLAGTLLLLTSWRPSTTRRLGPYGSSSLAGTPAAWWLRSPTYLSPSYNLHYSRKPRLGYR